MEWLKTYMRVNEKGNIQYYKSPKTGLKVIVKRTPLREGLAEIQVLKRIKGGFFAKLLDYEVLGSEMALSLSDLGGMTFEAWMHTEENTPSTLKVLALNAFQALDSLHRQGFYHRDIRPENIVVGEDRRVYLIDFGTSVRIGQIEPSTDEVFPTEYTAPEAVFLPAHYDGRSETYAMARVFKKATSKYKVHCDPEFLDVLERASEIIPEKRQKSAEEIVTELYYI